MIRNRKGSGAGLIGGILMFVVGGALMLVSIFIRSELGDTVNGTINNTTDLQTTFNDTAGYFDSGIQLMGITLIVIGAGVVISSIRSAF